MLEVKGDLDPDSGMDGFLGDASMPSHSPEAQPPEKIARYGVFGF